MKKHKFKNLINKLDKEGYVVIQDVFSQDKCDEFKKKILNLKKKLKIYPEYKDYKQGQFILRDLIIRSPETFLNVIDNKIIIKFLNAAFKEKFILDNIMASNSEKVKNFSRKRHIDQQLPSPGMKLSTDIVTIICLDDFTKSNGATIVWPRSHKSGIKIHKVKKKYNYKSKTLILKKGSIAIMLGQLWHQVGKNTDQNSRWSIFLHYKRWWLKSSTDFTKCGLKIFKMLKPKQKELLGFTSISPKYKTSKGYSELYTLRSIKKIPKSYKQVLNY